MLVSREVKRSGGTYRRDFVPFILASAPFLLFLVEVSESHRV
jgi:hypothetical protein